ncbi:MAG TPA: DUF4838 domain-containing protein [Candidatus Hydrogenedentes bacterium]|nr:DUF4838 domain-containing protein [Candidatus Hydrogenedentota bacterium]
MPTGVWINAGAYADLNIVIPEKPSPEIQYAADLFARLWQECTGSKPKISMYNDGRINVWLGPEIITRDLIPPGEMEELGSDGCIIRTLTPRQRERTQGATRQLIITGATDKGSLNGVFEFFQRVIGKQWLAPGVNFVSPVTLSIPDLDYKIIPHFSSREVGYYENYPPEALEYRRAHKFPDAYRAELSGVHTFYDLLPPKQFFSAHPEYYSEYKGKRIAFQGDWRNKPLTWTPAEECGQLCCANPAVADAIAGALKKRIQAQPGVMVWSVSQMDWLKPCQCAQCRAIDEREGTPMGSLLTLVNRVAEKIEQAFPEKEYRIHTLAYQYSRKPPKTVRPRANVIVQACSAECDFGQPLEDRESPQNAAFVHDLEAWSKLTDSLYIWDYAANMRSSIQPFPNMHVFQSNLQLYDQNLVRGVFVESPKPSCMPFSEFDTLRSYLLSKLLWDPDCPPDKAQSLFLNVYYGAAGQSISEYIHLMTNAVENENIYLGCREASRWWDYDLVVEAEKLFAKAFSMPLPEKFTPRVGRAYMPLAYAALVCPPKLRVENNTIVMDRPPSMTLDQFAAALTLYNPDAKVKNPAQQVIDECHGKTPPRHAEYTLVSLEDDRTLVWIVPELNGAVLRWKDKTLNMEWLQGFQRYESKPGVWQDWNRDPSGLEGSLEERYTVVENGPAKVVLQATRDNGLVITRTLTLPPGTGRLELVVSLQNGSAQPIMYAPKIHPEFFTQEAANVELWIQENGAWARPGPMDGYEAGGWSAWQRSSEAATAWAAHLADKGLTLYNTFDSKQAAGLSFYSNVLRSQQQINLDLCFPETPLAPGETRSLAAAYWTGTEKPQ